MGGQAEGLACTDLGVRTPIGPSGNFPFVLVISLLPENERKGERRVIMGHTPYPAVTSWEHKLTEEGDYSSGTQVINYLDQNINQD